MSNELEITYGIHASPFGWCLIGITKQGISNLAFLESENENRAVKIIQKTWPQAKILRDSKKTHLYIQKIFSSRQNNKKLPLFLHGTDFQMKVWKALQTIPKGKTRSYAEIAHKIGSPQAVRAVGTACGRNPIAFLIPCHRVLTSSGKLGGYRWGIDRKDTILTWEAVHKEK